MKASVLAEPALVGREHELEELTRYLNSAIEGKGTAVFISGEAGSGKTRFATEFLNMARNQEITILTGWCLSNAAVPYFPFFEAFKAYFMGEQETKETVPEELELTAWLTGPSQAEKGGRPQAISPQLWKDQTFVAVAKTLTAISVRKPVVLFIDDVHWADSASLALIHYIARATKSEKVLLIATYRSEELKTDAEGRPHPLVETLRLMKREDLVNEIKVASLNQNGVRELAVNMLGGELQPEFAGKLAGESQGNPLFVVESLRMLHEREGLLQDGGKWRLASDEIGIPAKIKDIILQRLNCLLRNQRKTVEVASVIGEKFDAELLASVMGLDSGEVIETLDVIGQTTSLLGCEWELYRFDHARTREAVYQEISPALKRVYHGKVAEQLESLFKDKLPFSELAYHFAQAGNEEKAVKYALAAGHDALSRWSNMEAIKHFTYVTEAVGRGPERAEERLSAMEGLGDAFYAGSMFKESIRIFEELGDTTETGVFRLRAYRKAMESAWQHGDAFILTELVKKSEPYVAADRLERARVLVSRARAFTLQGRYPSALEDCEAALQIFEEEHSLWDTALALLSVGVARGILGMAQEAIASALRSIALFEELGDFRWQMEAHFAAGVAFNMSFLEHEALDLLAKVVEIDEKMKMGDYIRMFHAYDFSATSFFQMGEFERALSYSLKALELSKKTDSMWAHGSVYRGLTMLYTIHGDLKNAEEFFEKLVKLSPSALNRLDRRDVLPKAVLCAGKEQWKESNQIFIEYLEGFKDHPEPANELAAKLFYAWALERQGRSEDARVQLEEAQRIRREAEERFEHANLQAHLMVLRQSVVDEGFEMRLDLVNVGRRPTSLVEVRNVFLDHFKVSSLPLWCSIQDSAIVMKNREIGPFQVETAKLTLKGLKVGTFTLNPQVIYVDDMGETKTCKMNTVKITVLPAPTKVRPGRVSSGMVELDDLLMGGIPENYSAVLTAPSSNEKDLLIKRFLETALQTGQTTLYLTTEAGNAKTLAETFPANFSSFLCSPQAELIAEDLPNLYRLKGVDNLTEIDIALAKYFRTLAPSKVGPGIACVQIISDVLLQHHAVVTRKWLSSLLANLKSRRFTTLALVDPSMHPPEDVNAILSLFDGELEITENQTSKGLRKILRIKRLYNHKYLEKELILDKD